MAEKIQLNKIKIVSPTKGDKEYELVYDLEEAVLAGEGANDDTINLQIADKDAVLKELFPDENSGQS